MLARRKPGRQREPRRPRRARPRRARGQRVPRPGAARDRRLPEPGHAPVPRPRPTVAGRRSGRGDGEPAAGRRPARARRRMEPERHSRTSTRSAPRSRSAASCACPTAPPPCSCRASSGCASSSWWTRTPYLRVRGVPIYEDERHDMASEALMRAVLALFEKVVSLNPNLPEDSYVAAMNEKDPGSLADLLAHVLDLEPQQRQELLETLDANVRLQRLSIILGQELDVLELEDRIQNQVQQEVDKSQREYYLREQMRAIQTELGEVDEDAARAGRAAREDRRGAPAGSRCAPRPRRSWASSAAMPPASPETTVVRNYLDWLLDLPWHDGNRGQPGRQGRGQDPRAQPLRPAQGQGAHPRAHRGAQAGAGQDEEPHPLLRRAARHRQDQPGQVDRRGAGPQVRAAQPGRRARRGRNPRAPPHLYRLAAGPHHPDDAHGRRDQPALHAGRDRQAGHGLPRRSVVGAARSARPGAEPRVQRSLPGSAVRPQPGDVHHHGQHPRPDPAGAARPDGGHRVSRLHRGREAGHRPAVPDPAAARSARAHRRSRCNSRIGALCGP